MQPVAIYTRLSLDRSGQMVQVARQRVDCERIAAARWPDAPVVYYDDNDTSAYQRKPRPDYQRMLAAWRAGAIQTVVAWNLDRLLRQPRELEELIDLGVVAVTATGDLDLTTHDGQLHARILVAVAKKSSDDTSRRVARAARDRAEAGHFHGARYIPFGLTRSPGGYTHDPAHVAIIRDVARQVLDGHSLTSAILHLQPPAPQTREAWRGLLVGHTIRGRNASGHAAVWDPMIDPATAAALHAALVVKGRRPSVRWPLSPVLRCGTCGGSMVGAQGHRVDGRPPHPHYRCRGASCTTIHAPSLEDYVKDALDLMVVVVRPEPLASHANNTRVAAILDHLAAEYARGVITRHEWEAARRATAPEDRSPVGGQAAVRVEKVVDGDVRTDEQLVGWRRLIAIDHITIAKARAKGVRFDEDRIDIRWRQ